MSISHDTLARRLVVSIIQVQRIPLKASPKVLATKTTAKTGTYRLKVTALTARQAGRLKQSRASKARQADQQGKCTNEQFVHGSEKNDQKRIAGIYGCMQQTFCDIVRQN